MPEHRPRMLFVCLENSCRSQMAEGFARAFGADRVSASSAGSRPAGRIDPRAAAFMMEKGIDLAAHRSKGLEDLPPGTEWDYVVTMGCGDACPQLPARRRLDWDVPDPKALSDEEFRRVRDRIEALVRDLVTRATPGARERGGTGEGR